MKKVSSFRLMWGGALLIGLLLAVPVAVFFAERRLARKASFLQTDSVPGLIHGHTLRSAYAEGLVDAMQAFTASTVEQRDARLRHLAELDEQARRAAEAYRASIRMDPVQDGANFQATLEARDQFLRTRVQFMDLVVNGRRADAEQFLTQRVAPDYDALMRACDVLIAYNNRAGTVISGRMLESIEQLHWVMLAVTGLAIAAGVVVGTSLFQRLRAEGARAQSAAELGAIFDSTAVGIALVGPEGRPIRCNPALERFLGYRSEELCAKTFVQFTHPDDVARDVALFEQLLAGQRDFYQIEKRYVRKDGATVWGELTVSIIRGEDGRLAHVVGMVTDVTEKKRGEQALRDSEAARQRLQEQLIVAQKLEALGQLAGGVAHDFNNMLAAITLYLDVLKQEPAISPLMRESLGELTKAAKHSAGLTRQLLLFSRREPAQRQVVDLNLVVGGLHNMIERLVGAPYPLEYAAAPGPLWLHADAGMIEQVVMNLVVNARDAMPQGGRIALRLAAVEFDAAAAQAQLNRRPGRFVRLAVGDTGCGMSAATRARIFEPFFTTKEAGKGTGLGLSTVHGIVQQHRGWIEVESEEGQGSEFAVYLPAHSGAAAEPAAEKSAASPARGHETIVIAEDNEQLRRVTARILRASGYEVFEADDGLAAKGILEARRGEVDLLLSDVAMPGGLMGPELAAKFSGGARKLKVILMSAHHALIDAAVSGPESGVYLRKPFDREQLLRVVRATLDGETPRA